MPVAATPQADLRRTTFARQIGRFITWELAAAAITVAVLGLIAANVFILGPV